MNKEGMSRFFLMFLLKTMHNGNCQTGRSYFNKTS